MSKKFKKDSFALTCWTKLSHYNDRLYNVPLYIKHLLHLARLKAEPLYTNTTIYICTLAPTSKQVMISNTIPFLMLESLAISKPSKFSKWWFNLSVEYFKNLMTQNFSKFVELSRIVTLSFFGSQFCWKQIYVSVSSKHRRFFLRIRVCLSLIIPNK